MPSVVVVAGLMVIPLVVVRNNSNQEVSLSNSVSVVRDPLDNLRTPDPREFFVVPRTGPGLPKIRWSQR